MSQQYLQSPSPRLSSFLRGSPSHTILIFKISYFFPESRRCSRNVIIALALKTLRLKNATRFCPSYQVRVKRKANEHVTFMMSFGFWTIGLRPYHGLWERFPLCFLTFCLFPPTSGKKKKPKARRFFSHNIFRQSLLLQSERLRKKPLCTYEMDQF